MRIYGPEYYHLHHYCWALVEERWAAGAPEKATAEKASRWSLLNDSRDDYKYVIDRSSDKFVLLPEILTNYARVLNALDRKTDAVNAILKAIRIRPDYLPAYVRLSDIYQSAGETDKAIRILEDGLQMAPGTDLIIQKLRALGVEPDPRYLYKVEKKAGAENVPADETNRQGSEFAVPAATPLPGDDGQGPDQNGNESANSGNGKNPYCRFCAE